MVAEFIPLKAPFPWFGGKSKAAHLFWQGFGDCPNYVEPFFGSGATLFRRADYDPLRHTETVNDLDCYLANFWRALQADPEAVGYWADCPVNEADLHARHAWLVNQADFRARIREDSDYFDVKVAGWWVWGLCLWIGSGWCVSPKQQIPQLGGGGKRPHLGSGGVGLHRKMPHLGGSGRGLHRKTPHLGDSGASDLLEYLEALAARLRRVRVTCGGWERVVTPCVTEYNGVTGVLLDPPYDQKMRNATLYSTETNVSTQVREWAIANGDNPMLRIALCGYAGEHEMPEGWQLVQWKAPSGFAAQNRDRDNQRRLDERIWFSPHCLPVFSDAETQQLQQRMKALGRTITREQAITALQAGAR